MHNTRNKMSVVNNDRHAMLMCLRQDLQWDASWFINTEPYFDESCSKRKKTGERMSCVLILQVFLHSIAEGIVPLLLSCS